MIDKALSDVATHFQDASRAHLRERIRVVATFDSEDPDMFKVLGGFIATYPTAYQTLLQEKPITCAKTGTTFDPAPAPTAIIMDFFALGLLLATREVSGNTIPIVAFLSSTAASTIRLCGPQEIGGLGDLDAQIQAEVERTGEPDDEVGEKGKLINIAGIPPMYDYEFFPQILPYKVPLSPLARAAHVFFKQSDGVIIATSETYEHAESVEAFRSWFAGWGKPAYAVGPLLPIGYGSTSVSSRGDTAVEVFLEKSLQKHGEKSVLFISLGTLFWPTKPEYVEELINALIEKEMPFVFCLASVFANVSDELHKKVEASGLGLLTKWAPQQYILTHKSIGWFLTHGGHGGTTEALANGIPLIGWPFMADQPIGFAQLAEQKGVAVELVEVRTGALGLRPIHRLGGRAPAGTREAVAREIRAVIDEVRGARGAEMGRNAGRVREAILQTWEEGGVGKQELRAFLKKFVDRAA
ncbi:UDP-Glycosyltransferase/glycogen phosphorylase [Pholiota molesta]|nr:UDP-Glycosyltransferase/glycogen phosphorylase [Pholiota molesta]